MGSPIISVSRADMAESGDLSFVVSLSEPSDEAVTITYRTKSGTSVPDEFYSGVRTGTLTIPAGDTTGLITVDNYNDSADEVDESIWLDLLNAQNGVFAGGESKISALGVVQDNDGSGSNLALFVSSPRLVEGDSGIKKAVFDVHLSRPHGSNLTLSYTTTDGTATAGSDYVAKTGTVTFLAGQTVASVEVDVSGDSTIEPSESFSLVVTPTSDIKNGTLGAAGEATIIDDDDGGPTISVTRANSSEDGDMLFEVSLSEPTDEEIVITYRTMAGTSVADEFYSGVRTGTMTIAAGNTTGYITVDNYDDNTDEVDESIWLELLNAQQGKFAGGELGIGALGVVQDNDGSGSNLALFVSSPRLIEGDGGTKKAVFEVHLSRPHSSNLTLSYATEDGTAKAGSDYMAKAGSVTFLAGQTVASVVIDVAGDTTVEASESFSLVVTPTSDIKNSTRGSTGQATIIDDDGASPTISVTRSNSTEDGDMVFEVHLSEAALQDVTIGYRTMAGTSVPDEFYSGVRTGTLVIAAGNTTGFITVDNYDDSTDEVDESIWLELLNANNGVLAGGETTIRSLGVVQDDDGSGSNLSLFVSSPTLVEGNVGTKKAVFEVHLSRPHNADLTLSYTTADGTARAGSDYVAKTGTVTFHAGQTVASVEVDVSGDTTVEATEMFSLVVSPSSEIKNGTLGAAGQATIIDTDGNTAPTISVVRANASEDGDMLFEVLLSKAINEAVTFSYQTMAGTSATGDFYSGIRTGTMTIAAGSTTGFISIDSYDDSTDEVDESIWLELFNAQKGVFAGGTSTIGALGVVQDDDGSGSNLSLFVSSPKLLEGSGARKAVFEVHLSRPHSADLTLSYTTADGSATAGSDYTAKSGTITFLAGQTVTTVEVDIVGDRGVEATENFSLIVTPTSAIKSTAAAHAGTATILNDDSLHETIQGDVGNESLSGFDGDDTMYGLAGNDTLDGGTGTDQLDGGEGDDVYIFNDAADTIVEDLNEGRDLVRSSLTYTLGANVEDLELTGTSAIDGTGNGGPNSITGNSGKNVLKGLNGADTLIGNGGNDRLEGGKGKDQLIGGAGADSLYGGGAKDLFVYKAIGDSKTKARGMDTIFDFKHSEGDRIDLLAIDANTRVAGNQKFSFVGTAAFKNKAGELRYEIVGSDSIVYGDVNGDGRADFAIKSDLALSLVKGDFVL
jgi:Ca2+-binding RTX toxin-like protein